MPDPSETNRERLLRLIDGGPEVVKEVQEERKPFTEDKKPGVITPVTPVPAAKKEDILGSAAGYFKRVRWDAGSSVKIVIVLALLVLTLRSASDLVRSFGKPEKTASAPVTAASAEDSGPGLRLVGVDWGEPPVALLEDLKTGKTYFARRNDRIKDTRVKEIFKDKVLINFHGKSLELR